jgi:tetratricopeptide (TPR) repeat protein
MFVLPVPDGVVPDKRQALFREMVLADGLAVVKEVTPEQCALLTAAGLHNLPREAEKTAGATLPPRPEIIGRRAEIDRIVAEVTAPRPRPVVILGHAGMGKTTVSRAVLHEPAVVERFGAHRFFAELATADDVEKFRIAVVLALGLDPRGVNFAGALAFLAQSAPALLVLDNLETPLADAASAPVVEEDLLRLAQLEGLALMGSRRGRDAPGGPRWLSLDPLARLSSADSHALLRRWAPAVPEDASQDDLPADLGLSDDGARPPRWLRKLLDALGGLPLALELMGRQIGGETSLALLWAEWRRLGAELLRRPGTPLEGGRLDSLFASLSFSTARLGPEGRRLFALLGRTPAGMAMADIGELLGDAAAEAMRQLRGSGLTEHPPGRLDLLPPVSDHALRAHPPAGPDAGWYRHYLASARDLGKLVAREGGAEALARLGPELPNVEAAVEAAIAAGDLVRALETQDGWALSNTIRFSGLGSGRALDLLATACAGTGDALGEANCRFGLGDIALARSDHDEARSRYEEALSLYRRVDDVLGEANCIQRLGSVALYRSDHDVARSRYEEALPLYHRVGDVLGEAVCIWRLGDIALRHSDHETAWSRYEEALPLYRGVGSVIGEANCINSLGEIALARADHEAARSRYEEALPLFRCAGQVLGEANCILGVGRVAEAQGDKAAARARYAEALSIFERIHRMDNVAIAHEDLADVTGGAERDAHVQAAKETWLSIGLQDKAARIEQRFR